MMRMLATTFRISAMAVLIASFSGCGGNGGSSELIPPGANQPPSVSGSPAPTGTVGQAWSFTPTASDPNGDALTFSIDNIPAWANFDTQTGQLSGTPETGDVGQYANIRITVSDGSSSAELPDFNLEIFQFALGSVTLSWTPPTTYEDGSAFSDLTGYNFYFGTTSGYYPNIIRVDSPGIASYVVGNLEANTYFFVASAVNAASVESRVTEEISIQVIVQ